jgi:hypothetical protein
MDTVSLCILTKLIRDFSIFTVSNNISCSPSAKCVNIANNICQFLCVFNMNVICQEDAFSLYNSG